MANYRMIIDAEQCVGCHACEVACKQEFQAPLGYFRTMTLYLDTGTFPKVKREFLPLMCRQCESADCISACTKDAMTRVKGKNEERRNIPGFTKEDDLELNGNIWWDKKYGGTGNGFNPNSLIPINPSPMVGMQAWNDTICKISKV